MVKDIDWNKVAARYKKDKSLSGKDCAKELGISPGCVKVHLSELGVWEGRRDRGVKGHKLLAREVGEIREMYADGQIQDGKRRKVSYQYLADRYGVSAETIGMIINRKTWRYGDV